MTNKSTYYLDLQGKLTNNVNWLASGLRFEAFLSKCYGAMMACNTHAKFTVTPADLTEMMQPLWPEVAKHLPSTAITTFLFEDWRKDLTKERLLNPISLAFAKGLSHTFKSKHGSFFSNVSLKKLYDLHGKANNVNDMLFSGRNKHGYRPNANYHARIALLATGALPMDSYISMGKAVIKAHGTSRADLMLDRHQTSYDSFWNDAIDKIFRTDWAGSFMPQADTTILKQYDDSLIDLFRDNPAAYLLFMAKYNAHYLGANGCDENRIDIATQGIIRQLKTQSTEEVKLSLKWLEEMSWQSAHTLTHERQPHGYFAHYYMPCIFPRIKDYLLTRQDYENVWQTLNTDVNWRVMSYVTYRSDYDRPLATSMLTGMVEHLTVDMDNLYSLKPDHVFDKQDYKLLSEMQACFTKKVLFNEEATLNQEGNPTTTHKQTFVM